MTRGKRALVSFGPRAFVASLLLFLLHLFQATSFAPFYVGAILVVLAAAFVRSRYRSWNTALDVIITYLALFLFPPSLIFILAKPLWVVAGLVIAAAFGGIWFHRHRMLAVPLLTLLWLGSIASALAVLSATDVPWRSSSAELPGERVRVDNAGWDNAVEAGVITTFPPRYQLPTLPAPVVAGDPPISRAFGVLRKRGNKYSVRPFAQTGWVELLSTEFNLPDCSPLLDVGFYRLKRQWLFLCGGRDQIVLYDSRNGSNIGHLSNIGPWPRHMTIHQDLDRVLVAEPAYGNLVEFDLESGEQLRKIHVGFGVADITLGPDNRFLYVALPFRQQVVVLDATTLERTDHVPAPFGLANLVADRVNNRLYGAVLATGRLVAIDPDSNLVVKKASLRSPVLDMAYEENTGKLYWLTEGGVRWAYLSSLWK